MLPALTLLVTTLIPAAPADEIVYKELNKLGSTKLAFDWAGLDADGQPVQTKHAEFLWRSMTDGYTIATSGPPVIGEGDVNKYLVRLIAATIPVGKYKVTVRVIAADAENRPPGLESDPLYFDLVEKKPPPAAPTGFRSED